MKKCPNCNRSIEGIHLDCPHCGYQLVTPEQAQDNIAALEEMKSFMLNLDRSPEGIKKTVIYLDNVMAFVDTYQKLLLQFMEEHKLVDTKQGFFGKKYDSVKAQSYLALMKIIWTKDNENFKIEIVSSSIAGCFLIRQKLIRIKDLTDILLTDYSNFFSNKDPHGLEKSKQGVGEISQTLNSFWSEIERTTEEMKGM